jgi:Zn-dependent protease
LSIDPGQIAVSFAVFLFSTTVHEASHAWTAWKWGDPTAKDLGRITLNPIPHIDIFGTVIVPLIALVSTGGIMGWASTPVDKSKMRDPKWGDFWTSAAGPISNMLLAILSFILLKLVLRTSLGASLGSMEDAMGELLWTGLWMNIVLMILNLLPIPPLDGSHLLQNLLPDSLADLYDQIRPFGLVLLIVVGSSGLLGKLVDPVLVWVKSVL